MASQDGLENSAIPGVFISDGFQPVRGGTFAANHRATGKQLARIARCGSAEINPAVLAAAIVFPAGRATPFEQLSALQWRLAEAPEADLARLISIDSIDIGKRFLETGLDQFFAVSQCKYLATEGISHEGYVRTIPDRY